MPDAVDEPPGCRLRQNGGIGNDDDLWMVCCGHGALIMTL
jgi:hypothetical protein